MADSLSQLAIQLTRSIVPLIMFVGVIGNSFNIAVLTRPALYNHACSRYFLALAGNNLFYSSAILTYRLLADGYQLDPTKSALVLCKLFTYVNQTCIILAPYFIVLASIDRYCASSASAQLRKFSDVKVARWVIPLNVILFALIYINTPILIDLRQTDTFGCRIRADTVYKQVYPVIQVFLVGFLAPFLMAFFGLMTIYNTKQVRVIPMAVSRHRRTENQLARMLLVQVSTHIALTLPTCVTYLILVLPTTISSTPLFYFARTISQLPLHFSFATAFILYLISAGVYRKELVRLVYILLRLRGRIQIHPTTNAIANTVLTINPVVRTTAVTRY